MEPSMHYTIMYTQIFPFIPVQEQFVSDKYFNSATSSIRTPGPFVYP